jgi:hypothetical protein
MKLLGRNPWLRGREWQPYISIDKDFGFWIRSDNYEVRFRKAVTGEDLPC